MIGSSPARMPPTRWLKVAEGVEMRPMVEGEGTALVLYRIAPGVRFAPHTHRFPEYGTLIRGHGRVLFDHGAKELGEGDSYYLPSGLSHGFDSPPQDGPVVMLHVAVGLAAQVRTSMVRHLAGQSRACVRPVVRRGVPAINTVPPIASG